MVAAVCLFSSSCSVGDDGTAGGNGTTSGTQVGDGTEPGGKSSAKTKGSSATGEKAICVGRLATGVLADTGGRSGGGGRGNAGSGGGAGSAGASGSARGAGSAGASGSDGASAEADRAERLLFKLLPSKEQYEAVTGCALAADIEAEASQVASEGFVITAIAWDTSSSDPAFRYLAFKPAGGAVTYEARSGYSVVADMPAQASQLASDGFVITTTAFDTTDSDAAFRYLAFKPVGSTVTYEAKLGYAEIPDMQAQASRLASDGFVVTATAWDTTIHSHAFRYFGFRPVGSTVSYEAAFGYAVVSDMQAEASQLAGDGFVITTTAWDTTFSHDAFRYLAFKPTGSAMTYEARLGETVVVDMQADASQLASDGFIITATAWDYALTDHTFRYLAFRPEQ